MNVNHIIAEKIMKWETDEESGRWKVKHMLLGKSYWNPTHTISDAWEVLETFEEGLVRKRMNGLNYRAWVIHENKECSAFGNTPSEAIVNVALKAHNIEIK
ncbi:hypothetical protein FJQ98_16035 [Lysinibacillus agricola]|uniref:Phage ABA sandwich domain-containing protein n=1 Tax=Lysinibacillus agricola TaxID=2590012 RepID=A0ABX7ALI9_9BACI|nr:MULTISPECIES: hypothetical protein [Lysinibacillus]KOS61546.1 hypothetical protein AN161_18325 [Lysinibacillus sp. FJAT-14222]QQP10755.1 hypothetical protein FJQ98_16035 [Lysinibacillus agricola]